MSAVDTSRATILTQTRLASLDRLIRQEMRNREIFTPPVSTFRWWARRSHALFGALVDAAAEALGSPLLVADPFAGGGTTVLEARLRGHHVYGQDINPWAARGMRAMLSLAGVDRDEFEDAVERLTAALAPTVHRAYRADGAWTTHTFRVATAACAECGETLWLYPYALLTLDSRRPDEDRAWLGCRRCGEITPGSRRHGAHCRTCGELIDAGETYLPRRFVRCPWCGRDWKVGTLAARQPLGHHVVLVERAEGRRRWFDQPRKSDVEAAETGWPETLLPDGEIPEGKETRVLLRHGFHRWSDLYPRRQRAVLTDLLTGIANLDAGPTVTELLTVAAVGTAEMAGLGSRWDRYYLKAYEATANHRFAFVPFSAEPNLWGHEASGRGTFTRRMGQLRKALAWSRLRSSGAGQVRIERGPSQRMSLGDHSADIVLTDPPYFGDVQYGELSGLFRAWLKEAGPLAEEVLVDGRGKGDEDYTRLLTDVLREAARVLKPAGRLIMTFHNRTPRAYVALTDALSAAGFGVVTWAWAASENERDLAKRDKSSCSMDLVLECARRPVPLSVPPPPPDPCQTEAHFLWLAGATLSQGTAGTASLDEVAAVLRTHAFVAGGPAT